ncbi:Yip1 family protein [Pseudomonas oryzihabitans]|uniref:Yip1 family protein n=1 Tax=Pseudomonas oryzihabitans TaxID=47885 RepID=UPI00111D93BF|nr:Yip1 family protein [Pseudomonas psychrotolerans]QDD87683.1 YIP1 family protein [Pseudomonas psychrotolerans]
MINHVWGLLAHPDREWQQIRREGESVGHFFAHHVAFLAAIPVVASLVGTTTFGWRFGGGEAHVLDLPTAVVLAVISYALIMAAVVAMGHVIHWLARRYPDRPSANRCILFAGYVATPMLLSGLVGFYPLVWLCAIAGIVGLAYSAYLLYTGIPSFLNIDQREGFIMSGSTLAIGVLVLEVLMATTVLMWGYGPQLFG